MLTILMILVNVNFFERVIDYTRRDLNKKISCKLDKNDLLG
jgi:hypothetical protein